VDVFITFKPEAGNLLVSLKPIYDYLKMKGGAVEREYIVLSGWPVQFLPPNTLLTEEAIAQAVEKDVAGMPARVITAEHLAAIALQTRRGKDKARLLQFVESGVLDAARFQSILTRYALTNAWEHFERQFLSDTP
jgi:hypothetical protein